MQTTARTTSNQLAAFDELTLNLSRAHAVLAALQVATEDELQTLAPQALAGCLSALQGQIEAAQAAARRLT